MVDKRAALPKSIADEVMYRSRLLCCICGRRGDHIHHLDENRQNNQLENLVLLCFEHHDEATTKAGLRRKLTRELIVRFREDWYEKVRAARTPTPLFASSPAPDLEDREYQLITDAVLRIEVQRAHYSFRMDWNDGDQELVANMRMYSAMSGPRARLEILRFLEHVASYARAKMPSDFARTLAGVIFDALPIDSLRHPRDEPITEREVEMLLLGQEAADSLTYDGAVKLDNLSVAAAGVELSWKIRLYADVNNITEAQSVLEREYRFMLETLQRPGLDDARELVRFFWEHGSTGDWRYPLLPDDLEEKIRG